MAKKAKAEGEEAVEFGPSQDGLAHVVSALSEKVSLLSSSLKEQTLLVDSQISALKELRSDLGFFAAMAGKQWGEPMRTQLANIVIHHKAPVSLQKAMEKEAEVAGKK